MTYRIWYVKHVCVDVEADNEDEALDLANDIMDNRDDEEGFGLDEIEEVN